ncbi:conserved hypothetical protein [Desulfosarcina cetonica]|uniref:hypothetical protein n=1 Tax=Desulfosarcina cetonica TaxID=90730 RepID=UPI000AC29CEA|nr:hypothetical protein [Desulfosarcina cetonica]VTR66285.1 conserved hypothetical protein [Desulfosarcina cetonica]
MHKFSLIENALDSLEHAIVHLNDKNGLQKGDYKRVILDLSHVAELLFKEKLRMIHPAFVLSNVDKYPSTVAHTVSAADALKRLQKIGNVEFKDEDQAALRTIREKRNEIEHYEFSISEKEARVVIGNVLVFIFRFATDEVGLDWADRRINDPAWSKLNEFVEFYEAQLAYITETLWDSDIPTQNCPICRNDTFDLESEVCVLCGHREEVLECVVCKNSYLYSDVEYEDAGLCPKCEWEDGYASANFEKY